MPCAASRFLSLLLVCASLVVQVANKSYFGIGTRAAGDQLILKDILKTPPIGFTQEPVINFKYSIVEPITYLEIECDKNVLAEVNFSYELDLVEGTIASINSQHNNKGTGKPEPFEVLIRIYGFSSETVHNVSSAHILNRDQQFNGVLKPIYQQQINQSSNLTPEDSRAIDDLDLNYDADEDDDDDDDDTGDEQDVDYNEDDFINNYDKIIEQGQRQEGDSLVYEISQTSTNATELPTNHSVVFYYIDIYHITCVKFIIFEHYLYHGLNNYENTYVVEYAQISPTTLKAIVTDHRTTSLFVQMQMYGFHPTALPVDYRPFLSNSQTSARTAPVSSLTQLKLLMRAEQMTTKQQQQQQQQEEERQRQEQESHTDGGIEAPAANELRQQVSLDNKSDANCMQQVVSSATYTGNRSQRILLYWTIFNLIASLCGTMLISM